MRFFAYFVHFTTILIFAVFVHFCMPNYRTQLVKIWYVVICVIKWHRCVKKGIFLVNTWLIFVHFRPFLDTFSIFFVWNNLRRNESKLIAFFFGNKNKVNLTVCVVYKFKINWTGFGVLLLNFIKGNQSKLNAMSVFCFGILQRKTKVHVAGSGGLVWNIIKENQSKLNAICHFALKFYKGKSK